MGQVTDKSVHAHRPPRGWSYYWQTGLLAVAVALLVVLVGLAIISLASSG